MCTSSSGHSITRPAVSSKPAEHLSIRDRILSIQLDSEYVRSLTNSIPGVAIVANERCGSWYVPPAIKTGSAYFKSTDGHKGSWSFNTRRLNIGLLNMLGWHGRCALVDSARRKAMPDALSKTVPIWATVMNRLLFPERDDCHSLCVDERHVALAEYSQIEERLDQFVEVAKSLQLDTKTLRRAIKRPIRVQFYCDRDRLDSLQRLGSEEYVHLICLSASMSINDAQMSVKGFHYVPGAGDDSEHWARGLTSGLLWEHMSHMLLCLDDDTAERAADEIVAQSRKMPSDIPTTSSITPPIYVSPCAPALYIGGQSALEEARKGNVHVDAAICCREIKNWPLDKSSDPSSLTAAVSFVDVPDLPHRGFPMLHLHCPARKLGSRALRTEFRYVEPFIQRVLDTTSEPRMLFSCDVGIDLAIGAALATTCLHVDVNGRFRPQGRRLRAASKDEGKAFVRRRLVQILEQSGLDDYGGSDGKGIQRTTLTAVNSLVIERPDRNTKPAEAREG